MNSIQSAIKTFLASLVIAPCLSTNTFAVDDGSQLKDPFRVNYAGYLPQANKTAFYLAPLAGPIEWQLDGTDCAGTSNTYVSNDHSSGDSFYVIDFSKCTQQGDNLRIQVGKKKSAPFSISSDPYGPLKFEFFDYFRDHEASATFTNAKNNWATGLSIQFSYVKDAGDNGAYPTNTAEASWALINMLETYPKINRYYSDNLAGARTVYEQLLILTEQFHHVFDHGGPLAIPKFHTNVNPVWGNCDPHTSGTCISEPETKATLATARTLGGMARIHLEFGTKQKSEEAYKLAQSALDNARKTPLTCRGANAFGGEGGDYPDNDVYSLWRDPKADRDNCFPGENNTQDDEYTALVELYLAALKLNKTKDAAKYKAQVLQHEKFNATSSYWWGAVATEGSLSLLSNQHLHDIDLSVLKSKLKQKAESILKNQNLGYPGVTWDPHSKQWNNGDKDEFDNNVRWGSHRMALNDARILMAVAELEKQANNGREAAKYARSAVNVLDHISGLNAVNLAMYTAKGYPYIENAVERTHDGANNDDTWPGKMVLGPNNWTNASDAAMPKFGSKPGLKMFALTGTGWASREISIDGNASLIPVAYFTAEVAQDIMALAPYPQNQTSNTKKVDADKTSNEPNNDEKTKAGGINPWGLLFIGFSLILIRIRHWQCKNRSTF